MSTGGDFGIDNIEWFNGGLFDQKCALFALFPTFQHSSQRPRYC
jgi:hypothetical protein